METFHQDIVACYLYVITKYGYPPPAEDTFRYLEEYRDLGFRSLELEGIRKEHLEKMHALGLRTRERAESMGLRVPVFCAVLPGLSSPDQKEREVSLELFEMGCETAGMLGAEMILDNAPLPPWQFPEGIPVTRHYDEELLAGATIPEGMGWRGYMEGLVETIRTACDMAARRNLTFQLHPCYGALVHSTDAFLLFADAVKRDNLRFNLDTANQYFMKDNLYLSLIRLDGLVDYIHLSDNRGHRVEHLVPGSGKIDWNRFFETLDRIDYNGRFGIDVGGTESGVDDMDGAYRFSASWLTENWYDQRES